MIGNTPRNGAGKISTLGMLAYAAPVCAMIFLWNPTVSVLPGLYAKYFGLPLEAIATVLLVARIADGCVDPLVGFLADRHRSKGGSRKIWVTIGGALLVASAYFLFTPPAGVSIAYYMVWSLAFYLAWTIIDVPHISWGTELSGDYDVRARIYSFRGLAVYVGIVAFTALPFLTAEPTGQFTPDTMRRTVMVGALAMLAALLFAMKVTPNGEVPSEADHKRIWEVARSVIANRPLKLFLLMYLLFSLSVGMWTGVLFLYLDTYLGFEKQTATIFFLFSLAAMVSIPLWGRLAERTHKTRVLCVGIGLQLLSLVVSIPLSPGVPILLPVLTLSGVYIGMAGFSLITPAILADIVDYGAWKFRQNRGSTYFSLLVLAFKAASGLGAGLSLALLAGFSYDPKGQSGGPWAETGMLIAFLGLPACLSLIALWLAWATPITRRRHRAIRRRLEARAAAPAIG